MYEKWDTIEPTQNTFSYTKGDAIANLAEANGQKLRCHNLVWHSQLPSWGESAPFSLSSVSRSHLYIVSSGTWTNATLIAAMKNHITNVVTHYKGQCYAWDVVNEGIYSVFSKIWTSFISFLI